MHKTIILPVFYEYRTWSLILREDHSLRVFENRVPKGPKRNGVTIEWRKLHSGEFQNLYSTSNTIRQIKSRRMRWVGHVVRMGEGRKVYRVLVGKPEGKRSLGGSRRSWGDGVKMEFRETDWEGVDWSHLAQDRDRWRAVVNTVMNPWVLAPRS
jgi:hypothetical protein